MNPLVTELQQDPCDTPHAETFCSGEAVRWKVPDGESQFEVENWSSAPYAPTSGYHIGEIKTNHRELRCFLTAESQAEQSSATAPGQ